MNRSEVDFAIDWAAEEGWNPGIHDADCFYGADPNGFLIGYLGDEPIATISVIKYSETYGFLGFYIVKPEYRGKGYGIKIWNAGLEYLKTQNIGLDGVVDQQSNYHKSGFKLAHRNIRYEGYGGDYSYEYPEIVELSSLQFDIIDSYDRAFSPAARTQFLNSWINQSGHKALGFLQNGNPGSSHGLKTSPTPNLTMADSKISWRPPAATPPMLIEPASKVNCSADATT